MRDSLLQKMNDLARSYVPEWSFTRQEPDAGSVVALLVGEMLEESLSRYDRVLHKHRVQYLNLFDRLKEEPAEAARSFVQFVPVAGAPEAVHIPAGTALLADSPEVNRPIVFETTHGLTATPAAIAAIFTTDGRKGAISRQYAAEDGGTTEQCRFTAFHTGEENLEEHVLLLGFARILDHLERLEVELVLSAFSADDAQAAAEILCESASFSVLTAEGFAPFDEVEALPGAIRLRKERFQAGKAMLSGLECCQIAVRAGQPLEVQICGAALRFRGEDILPDEVRCAGITRRSQRFHPFGLPMELYAACELESRSLLARRGAQAAMTFSLGYETVDRLLPEYQLEQEYKVVMRRPPNTPKPVIQEVRADEVLLEYLSDTGWRPLAPEEPVAPLFGGTEPGEVSIPFRVPMDLASEEQAAGQPRLRLRLLRAQGLYQLPSRQHCPVVENLRFSFTYADSPPAADAAVIRNNFEVRSLAEPFAKGQSAALFYTREYERPALYLGFDENPWGAPLSVYLGIENNGDIPVDFSVEYTAPGGFVPLKVQDGTGGLRSSGALLMLVGRDCARRSLFGRELYWLRLLSGGGEREPYELPEITGIYLNMARVENTSTRTALFYLENSAEAARFSLGEQGLLSARVYVNEAGAEGENWVPWRQAGRFDDEGRTCEIDLVAGWVSFAKGVFTRFPVREDGPAVKVVYQGYSGASANVEAGSIHTLSTAIRYLSGVRNPLPAFGGYDAYNEETAAAVISNMLRTRGRAVTEQDYFDLISQVSSGVRRIKCICGRDLSGESREDALTIAVLIEEYEKGGHIFSEMRQAIREKLLTCSGLGPAGKQLLLTQPRFVRVSARLWLRTDKMENAFDLQQQCTQSVGRFIDPLRGGFEGRGWEIGVLPTPTQLAAYIKIRHPELTVDRLVMTARFENREYAMEDSAGRRTFGPLAMAVNGEHMVYCRLAEE